MRSLRVGHDWMTSLWLFTFMHWRRKWQPTPVFLPGESQGRGSLVGCHLGGRTESDTTEAMQQQQQQIWSTVSYQSCFCWLYRVSPSLVAKNIINLISVLTIWWCPCVESSLVLLEEGVCYDQCVLLAKLSLCPASFFIPRPNLPVFPGISWLPTFSSQSLTCNRV